jgi:hypothetical protein
MTNIVKFQSPGTPLSCAAYAVAEARLGSGVRWTAIDSSLPQGHPHGADSAAVELVKLGANGRQATLIAPVSVRGAADFRMIKQFRVPSYLRERRT